MAVMVAVALTMLAVVSGGAAHAAGTAPMLSIFAGTGASGTPTPGPATSSTIDPSGVAVDASGNVYIADYDNNVVEKVTPDGTLSIFAGTGTYGTPTEGPATSSNLKHPSGVAVDASGNVYIADRNNHVIEKVTPDGTLSIFAGTGSSGTPTEGPATSSDLDNPLGVAVDASGNVYIADRNNNVIEKVTPDGTLSIFAGTGTSGTPTPGPATTSDLNTPSGVAVDASGNVYIADRYNNVIEKVTPDGTLSIFAGTGTSGTPTEGPATSSDLLEPTGVAVGANYDVYIADTGNAFVEKVIQSTAPSAPTGVSGSPGDGQVTVSWTAPASDGGLPITGYTVTASPGGATCTTTGATSCVVTGLTNGTSYTFTVIATNAVGSSEESAPSSVVIPAPATPDPVIGPSFTG